MRLSDKMEKFTTAADCIDFVSHKEWYEFWVKKMVRTDRTPRREGYVNISVQLDKSLSDDINHHL